MDKDIFKKEILNSIEKIEKFKQKFNNQEIKEFNDNINNIPFYPEEYYRNKGWNGWKKLKNHDFI